MLRFRFSGWGGRLAVLVGAAFLLGACASAPNGLDAAGKAAAPGTPEQFVVAVGDRVFYTVNSATLSREAQVTLDKQAAWLNQYPRYQVTIEGHADERGTREYNLALGARRATAARNYLVSKGVDASRLRTISYGKERPVAVCNDISCWSQNRRAVTVLSGQAGS